MLRIFLSFASLILFWTATSRAGADDAPPQLPDPKACELPSVMPPLEAAFESGWTVCEKWVWSCIAEGKEANLYAKLCTNPRRDADEPNYRAPYVFAPFHQPDAYAATNAVGDGFLRTILTDPSLSDRIPAAGVRIFGAYFERAANLENVTTAKNLVLDGSIFKRGLRMTNFETTKNVSLDGANLRGQFLLMRARISGSLFLERGVYDFVDARDARIGASLEASRSVFNDMLRFDRAQISGKVYLVKSLITSLNAWDATIGGSMELRLSDIRLRMDLTGSTVHGDVRLQEVSSGLLAENGKPSCLWNPEAPIDHVLHESYKPAQLIEPALGEKVLDEIMRKRPTKSGSPTDTLCDEATGDAKRTTRHEFLLRDMNINGTLCVMDTSGVIGTGPAAPGVEPSPSRQSLETISLDGTEANSTVLRWTESNSTTLWRAVNFKTRHMLINLQAQPNAHFIDNLDVGFISIVKSDPERRSSARDEDDDKYLCDVTPRQETIDMLEGREAQMRLIAFFTGPVNKSGSAQPFAHIVSRLESSGINSKYLHINLSEFKHRNSCRTSQLMQNWNELPWASVSDRLGLMSIDEGRKFVLDGVCSAGLVGYRWLVSYGHEPLNLFLWMIALIFAFWLALKRDRKDPVTSQRRRYPVVYAIDNFNPLRPYRMDRRGSERPPIARWLRIYLGLHRTLGVIFAILFFIFVYRAST